MAKTKRAEPIRLNKLIAETGYTSRRKADELIENGDVKVNGRPVFELGVKVVPHEDVVTVRGKRIEIETRGVYLMVNKPKGMLTSTSDPLDRPVITDLVEEFPERLYPVGRLDWDSEGLVLLTNDGTFANRVTHPKHEITKSYLVKVDGIPENEKLRKLLRGVSIVGGKVAAKEIEWIPRGKSKKYSWLKVIITEGKNRQIRKMFEKIGYDVLKLQRVGIGQLKIGKLPKGEYVILKQEQLAKIFQPDSCMDPIGASGSTRVPQTKKKTTKKAGATRGASQKTAKKSTSRRGSQRGPGSGASNKKTTRKTSSRNTRGKKTSRR